MSEDEERGERRRKGVVGSGTKIEENMITRNPS